MVGDRDREREAVRWELGETTPPPFNNGGPGTMCSGPGAPGSSLPGGSFDDGTINTTTNIGGFGGGGSSSGGFGGTGAPGGGGIPGGGGTGGGGGTSGGGGSTKEVRYAPFPIQSPTHPASASYTQVSQAPLQRAHSR